MKNYILLTLALAFIVPTAFGQRKLRQADKYFNSYDFDKAAEMYAALDEKNTDIYRKMAESHRYMGNTEIAEKYYEEITGRNDHNETDLYYYAAMLRSNGKYEDAQQWMKKYSDAVQTDGRAKAIVAAPEAHKELSKDQGKYSQVRNLDMNTEHQDFGTAFSGDKVVFTSSKEYGSKSMKRRWNWNGLPFLDTYVASKESNGDLKNISHFSRKINKKYHEGPVAFSSDGSKIAFTQNNYKGKSSDGSIKLKLFIAEKDGKKWSAPKGVPFNSDEYSVGHGTFSPDGKTLFFASDMPGGHGGVDIYKSELDGNGQWGKPVNLGSKINTEGDEMFPFFHREGILFFASDGLVGLGGLDIFMVQVNDDNTLSTPINLGYPINDKKDDFAVSISDDMKLGYFSSNRPGGKGNDDIYAFDLLKPFTFDKTIKGITKDKNDAPIPNVSVTLFDSKGKTVGNTTTDDYGNFSFSVAPDEEFTLNGKAKDYFDGNAVTSTTGDEPIVHTDLTLEKDPGLSLLCLITEHGSGTPLEGVQATIIDNITGHEDQFVSSRSGNFRRAITDKKINDRVSYQVKLAKPGYLSKNVIYNDVISAPGEIKLHEKLDISMDKIEMGTDVGKLVHVNPIYFDVNKANIRPDAAKELDKIVATMKENPNIEIELGSHTDARGSDRYNLSLSDRRAKASAAYIVSKGISSTRIKGKGYGESRLVNRCGNGVKCSNSEHQKNRRTEFKITKF